MRVEHLFFSLISLCLGFFLFVSGAFLFLITYIPSLEENVRSLLLDYPDSLSKIGLAIMAFGCLTLTIFGFLSRRRYFLIKMGEISIHQQIIAEIAKKKIIELFPESSVDCDVIIHKKGKIEILANIPSFAKQKEEVYINLEKSLVLALAQCGIQREFLLNVRFS